jgi:hypothetical protein
MLAVEAIACSIDRNGAGDLFAEGTGGGGSPDEGPVGGGSLDQGGVSPVIVSGGGNDAAAVVVERPDAMHMDGTRPGDIVVLAKDSGAVEVGPPPRDAAVDDEKVIPPPVPLQGLLLWLSADQGIVEAAGHVTRWRDRSTRGNDAVQLDTAAQPTSTPAWRSGRPAVQFDGVTQFLQMPPGFSSFPGGLSVFLVGDVANGSACPSFLNLSNGGESDDISLHLEDNQAVGYEVLYGHVISKPFVAPPGEARLIDAIHDVDKSARLYVSGALSIEGSFPLPTDVQREIDDIGRSSYTGCALLEGHIAEVLLYDRALDNGERTTVEGYLKDKWSL